MRALTALEYQMVSGGDGSVEQPAPASKPAAEILLMAAVPVGLSTVRALGVYDGLLTMGFVLVLAYPLMGALYYAGYTQYDPFTFSIFSKSKEPKPQTP